MDRERRRYDDDKVQMIGRGESYRPGGGPVYQPPRPEIDSYRADARGDTYVPRSRFRSRSPPPFRRRSRSRDRFSDRARSPRRFSPRREDRMRSPPRRRSRSPFSPRRDRSPPPRRVRSPSPYSRRSPLPRRGRFDSPPRSRYDRPRSPFRRGYSPPRDSSVREGYRTRSRTPMRPRSPPRRKDPYTDDNWRRRSPSPRGPTYSGQGSGPGSATDSRRSSPPVHPDRVSLAGSRAPSPGYRNHRGPYDSRPRSPVSRPRSPPRRERERSPVDIQMRDPSPPKSMVDRTRDSGAPVESRNGLTAPIHAPTGPRERGGAYNPRPPPSGPASQMSPPTGPSSQSTPTSISAHNRVNNASLLSAPTRPRGGPPPRGPAGYPAAPAGRSSSFGHRDGPPSGPRGFGRGESSSSYDRPSPVGGPAFRHSNSSGSSTTYPRTQRFNTTSQYLNTNEKIIPGGKFLPSGLPPDQERRMKQLEADAEKLRDAITEKQRSKREVLRDWDVRERESESAGMRSELAERHLEKLTEGEDGIGGAAF